MILLPKTMIHEMQLFHVMKHTGSVGLSNVQQSPPQRELSVYQSRDLRSDTTCWESQLPLDQNL